MATILKMDGTREELVGKGPKGDLTLRQAQKAVGGRVEVVHSYPGPGLMLANEDGLRLELSQNEEASELAGTFIVGDVVVCDSWEFT